MYLSYFALTLILHRLKAHYPPDGTVRLTNNLRQRDFTAMNAYKCVSATETASILIVDDKALFRHVLTQSLNVLGYRVYCAANRQEALKLCKQSAIHLTLLDIHLQNADGYLLCTELAKGHNIPVIVVLGSNRVEDILQGFAAGASDFIQRPFQLRELSIKIHQALHNERLRSSFRSCVAS